MPNLTQNLGLKKPLGNETADINVINENFDIIDSAIAGKANVNHTHTKAQISDFSHNHTISEVVTLQTQLDTKANINHTHTKANITDFAHTHTVSDITNISTANVDMVDGKHASVTLNTTEKSDLAGAINEVNNILTSHLADYVRQPGYAVTGGTSTAYTVTLSPAPSAYIDGMQITIVPHIDCGASPTLNVNGLGALTILKQDGSTISSGDLKANKPYSLVRVGSNFFLRSINQSNIKSVQRGEATLSAGVASLDVSINSVDTSKSILRISNIAQNSYASRVMIDGDFTSSTNIRFSRQNGTSFSQSFAWEVIEFNNVKSMQTGALTPSASTTTVTVNSVDINKSILFITASTSNYDTSLHNGFIQYSIVNSTTIKFIVPFNNVYNIRWRLIEFN